MTAVDAARATRRRVLTLLYGERAEEVDDEVQRRIDATTAPRPVSCWDERAAWMISYPNQFRSSDESPLRTLRRALTEHLQPEITGVHVLPFHPWSSDGGFSVTSFADVDPAHGTWEDIAELAATTDLMADAVINHASAQGDWFRGFLAGDPAFGGFFREVDADADLTDVVRPRSTPIPAEFTRDDGTPVTVWTTFSRDQIDLDYRNPAVLLAATDVVLSYVAAGARAIRLDAVAFVWKQEGTSSIHLPETHAIVQFLRACLDEVDPHIALITETNVPHGENISYFGPPGVREAQAVYQFPLPPLTLHSFLSGSAVALRDWARSLTFDRDDTTFLNFLASHDGVGLRPVEGLLGAADRQRLEDTCARAGGVVNRRRLPDGTEAGYELTGTWFSMLAADHSDEEALERHVASHAIPLALRGLPLLYVHSLTASSNDRDAYLASGQGRDLNRATFDIDQIGRALTDPSARASRTWSRLRTLLRSRASSPAFHPDAEQLLLDAPDELFVVQRTGRGGGEALVVVNVSGRQVSYDLPGGTWEQIDGGQVVGPSIDLPRWHHAWLRRADR
ncbi:MAG: alpha-amylase family glycosyl hydrolase [Ilumatobacter sp.]|uniref:alpha-amylase family glycosyl hydrolase n=1 Tax=Ilumatobacter sp. TaxID=1967498 RepID=UPI0026077AC5|nr:alpha-amylase family glycosyl hydrolase [Ilumatobacter sp.]MDJ0769700.1 alpha-amylase family glycosyl hydrolase [Ilumatobacter sp.]